jgi:hypothetical protein
MYIITNKPAKFGRTRSVQEKNLRKEWGQEEGATITDEQMDKLEYLEKERRDHQDGSKKNFIGGHLIDEVN